MALSRTGTGRASIRVSEEGNTTSDYADHTYYFADYVAGATESCKRRDSYPLSEIVLFNDGTADIYVTFNLANTHSIVGPGEKAVWRDRVESAIAIRTNASRTARFRLEAW